MCDGLEKGTRWPVGTAELEIKPGDWVWRRGGRGEDLKLTFLLPRPIVTCGFPGNACWCWGLRKSNERGGEGGAGN